MLFVYHFSLLSLSYLLHYLLGFKFKAFTVKFKTLSLELVNYVSILYGTSIVVGLVLTYMVKHVGGGLSALECMEMGLVISLFITVIHGLIGMIVNSIKLTKKTVDSESK